jgi:hypothetical protein
MEQSKQMQAEQEQAEQTQSEQQAQVELYKSNDYKCIVNALKVIEKDQDLVDFIKNFNEEGGFMFSFDKRLFEIYKELDSDDHSASSFAITLRCCQNIFRGTKTLYDYA